MEEYYIKTEAEIIGNGHMNPDGQSYLPAEEWQLIKDAMDYGLKNRIFELRLEIMKKGQELDLLEDVKKNPEQFFTVKKEGEKNGS